jgi:gas vesicle protein
MKKIKKIKRKNLNSSKKSKVNTTSPPSKDFNKTLLFLGLILLIGAIIGLIYLVNRDDTKSRRDENSSSPTPTNGNESTGSTVPENGKSTEKPEKNEKTETSNNNSLIIALSIIGFVYITGVAVAFFNNKGPLSFASWFALIAGIGGSVFEKENERSENESNKDKETKIVKIVREKSGKKISDTAKKVREKSGEVLRETFKEPSEKIREVGKKSRKRIRDTTKEVGKKSRKIVRDGAKKFKETVKPKKEAGVKDVNDIDEVIEKFEKLSVSAK